MIHWNLPGRSAALAVLVPLAMATACSAHQESDLRGTDPVDITITGELLNLNSKDAEVKCETDADGHPAYTAVGWARDGKIYTFSIRETAGTLEAVFQDHYDTENTAPYRSSGPRGIAIDEATRTATVDADLTRPSAAPGEPAQKVHTKTTIPCP